MVPETAGKSDSAHPAHGVKMSFLFVLLASVIYGCVPSLQEAVMLSGASPLGLVAVCNTVAALAAGLMGLIRHESFRLERKTLPSLFFAGAVGLFLTDYLLNLSYTFIPVGFVTMIHFLYPTIVCLAMVILFREKLTKGKVGAILCSIAGLALLAGGDFSGDRRGIPVALATAFAYAYYMIANDRSPLGQAPLMVRSFYLNLLVALTALGVNLFSRSVVLPVGAGNWALSILIGCLISTATILLNAGIRKLGAAKASFINMLEPVTSLLVSVLVYRYSVTVSAIFGCILILASLLLITLEDRKQAEKP